MSKQPTEEDKKSNSIELLPLDEEGKVKKSLDELPSPPKEETKKQKKSSSIFNKIFLFLIIVLVLSIFGYLIYNDFHKLRQKNVDLFIVQDYDQMSKVAGDLLVELIQKKPNATIGLATGKTPLGLYKYLIQKFRSHEISFQNITVYSLDEFAGVSEEDAKKYLTYMDDNLFNYIDINRKNIHLPKTGSSDQYTSDCEKYNRELKKVQLDFQLLGIGANGHIGFNEPGTPFDSEVHMVYLTERTRKDCAKKFGGIENVPKRAITVGIKNILDSKMLVLIANGESKAEAIKNVIDGEADPKVPASALRLHKGKTIVVADEEACKLLNRFKVNKKNNKKL